MYEHTSFMNCLLVVLIATEFTISEKNIEFSKLYHTPIVMKDNNNFNYLYFKNYPLPQLNISINHTPIVPRN